MQIKGIIFILSAPSGGGKGFIASNLLKIFPEIKISISHTTRQPRVGEVDGKDYFFCAEKKFEKMISGNEFLEYAKIYNNYYGTSKKPIIEYIDQGDDLLFDIDFQGAQKIKKNITSKVVTIFLLPTDLQTLKHRLIKRADHHDEENLLLRTSSAIEEIKTAKNYDYLVINDQIEQTLLEIKSIIIAERIKNQNEFQLQNLLTKL